MEIRVLKYFLAVAREKNITKAANILHISQPSLSTQIKTLEEEIGKKLFERGKRNMTLTEDGLLLRKRAQEIIDLLEITESELKNTDDDIYETINIGAGESEGMKLFARAIKELLSIHPKIKFNIFSGNQEEVTEKLDKGLIDFGILIEPSNIDKYNYYKLPYFDTSGILTRKDSKLGKLQKITKEDLYNENIICSKQCLINKEYDAVLTNKTNIIGTYTLAYNASLLVQEGIGSMTCIKDLINTDNTNLIFIPFDNFPKSNWFLVWKKYQPLSKGALEFLRIIQYELK